jgi:hypothetical protein
MNIKLVKITALSFALGYGFSVGVAPAIATTGAAGIEFESSPNLNQTTLVQEWVNHERTYRDSSVKYESASCAADERRGHIPADIYGETVLVSERDVTPYRSGQPRTKAFFRSPTTAPAAGLRVVIRNLSIAGSKTPYADREYEESNKSEKFFVSPETEHKSKYLAVQTGENRMSYEIRRGQQVIEAGEFVTNIQISDRYVTRTITHEPNKITIPCIKKDHDEHGRKRDHKRDHKRRHRLHGGNAWRDR